MDKSGQSAESDRVLLMNAEDGIKWSQTNDADLHKVLLQLNHTDTKTPADDVNVLDTLISRNSPNTMIIYKCGFCRFKSKSRSGLRSHLRFCNSLRSENVIYTNINRTLPSRCTGTSNSTYECKHCKFSSRSKPGLLSHLRSCHTGINDSGDQVSSVRAEQMYKCKYCSFTSTSNGAVVTHQNSYHRNEVNEKPDAAMDVQRPVFKCEHCRFTSITKQGVLSHVRSCHNQPTNSEGIDSKLNRADQSRNDTKSEQLVKESDHRRDQIDHEQQNAMEMTASDVKVRHTNQMESQIECDIQQNRVMKQRFSSDSDDKSVACGGQNILDRANTTNVGTLPSNVRPNYQQMNPGCYSTQVNPASSACDPKQNACTNEEERNANNVSSDSAVVDGSEGSDSRISDRNTDSKFHHKSEKSQHDQMTDFRCSWYSCNYSFSAQWKCYLHQQCHNATFTGYTCPQCYYNCCNWQNMSMHLWCDHRLDVDLYKCSQCEFRTYCLSILESHQALHTDPASYQHAQYQESFHRQPAFVNHNFMHSDQSLLPQKI